MKEQLLSYEIDAITGAVSIKKRKYTTETDEFGVTVTKPTNWRGVVVCGDDAELEKHFNKAQSTLIKSIWTPKMRAKRKALEAEADATHNISASKI